MPGEVKDECGVAAVYLPQKPDNYPLGGSAFYLYNMLLQMQNRGQLSAGITTFNEKRQQLIDTFKKVGTVNETFAVKIRPKAQSIMRKFSGSKGIGHVRYSTFGGDDRGSAQPFERHHGRKWKWFSFAFNGNIANFSELKAELEKKQYHLVRNLDTELILHFLEKEQVGEKETPMDKAFSRLAHKFDGAYNIVYINAEGTLAAMRDPLGNRPLCYSASDEFVGAASESVALANIVSNGIKPIKPGEMLIVENDSVEVRKYAESKKIAHCMFEWVYFSNAASTIEGKSVYQVRWNLGAELARQEKLETTGGDWVVVPVPDTAKPAADAYAHELGLPAMEGLIRNRYVGRTFIESNDRLAKIKEKFNVNKSVLDGKKVIIVDDSIVRGTTSKALIDYMREKGKAKEIHMRISCPPVRSPCFYGIDMSTIGELIANRHSSQEQLERTGFIDLEQETVDKIASDIGVDSLQYMTLAGLVKSIGISKNELCMACLTGEYPTPWGQALRVKAMERFGRGLETARTYE
ncbi:MAG TPA: amidophosphoribosyltransferase [Candidatus Diapherotrites archaeon]|uniref:Amidophosphoribosyltransferase n=1 Tax=Candidatus Iainarchaeum sp. TaxID=3101447 RepID=A0A7J4IYN9_9ARCH|nr:amidophosphoribosyltransferase [Candidatus Diapherotrites archaeon]